MVYFHEIETAEQSVTHLREDYLRRWGWKSTCNTPGAFWVRTRDFAKEDDERRRNHEARQFPSPFAPYGVVMADTELAVSMTARCLDTQPELGDGDD